VILSFFAGGRRCGVHDIFVDVLITVTLMVCFYGTFSGMTAAMVGGLTASLVLFVMKKTMPHEKLTVEKGERVVMTTPVQIKIPTVTTKWKTVEPDWRS